MNEEEMQGAVLPEENVERPKKPSDPKLSILMLQLTACFMLAAAAVCIRFFGGSLYGEVREKYIAMFENATTAQEVLNFINTDSDPDALKPAAGSGGVDVSSFAAGASSAANEPASSAQPDASQTAAEDSSASSDASSNITSNASSASQDASVSANALPVFAPVRFSQQTDRAAAMQSMCMPTKGFVSSEYGWRDNPVTGDYLLHAGIDLAADTGQAVLAALAGEVVTVEQDADYGNYVVLQHTGGLRTLYAHLSETLCREGEWVQWGERIARVGSTGRSTGPHLHFEVRTLGGTVNPRYVLPALSAS